MTGEFQFKGFLWPCNSMLFCSSSLYIYERVGAMTTVVFLQKSNFSYDTTPYTSRSLEYIEIDLLHKGSGSKKQITHQSRKGPLEKAREASRESV